MTTFINNQRLARLAGVDFNSEQVVPGPLMYSRTHTIMSQMDLISQCGPCVLITSFSDSCCTQDMANQLPENVIRWYSNNVTADHPRVRPVPIGLRTSPEGETVLRKALDVGRLPQRNYVYMNFYRRIGRMNNPRRGLYERFGGRSYITVEGGFDHVSMTKFYEQIASHQYVISPPGAGPDCHRHWEAILLGSIPIVKRCPAMKMMEGFPCLLIDIWDEVNRGNLERQLPGLLKKFDDKEMMKRVWFEYWRDEILWEVENA